MCMVHAGGLRDSRPSARATSCVRCPCDGPCVPLRSRVAAACCSRQLDGAAGRRRALLLPPDAARPVAGGAARRSALAALARLPRHCAAVAASPKQRRHGRLARRGERGGGGDTQRVDRRQRCDHPRERDGVPAPLLAVARERPRGALRKRGARSLAARELMRPWVRRT